MNDGTFRIRAIPLDGQNIKVETVGMFAGVEEKIVSYHRVDVLVVNEPSKLRAELLTLWQAGVLLYISSNLSLSALATVQVLRQVLFLQMASGSRNIPK